jgi:DNA-binding CsgD family transcriptional regulator
MLRELFNLTAAEAQLAQALAGGATASTYARERGLSANTIYTHLRRIKEKTGCSSLPQLVRKLNSAQVAIRSG